MSVLTDDAPAISREALPWRRSETLAEHAARLDALLATATDTIITIDAAGIILDVNPAVERTFGYHPAELIGHPVAVLMPSPYSRRHQGFIDRFLAGGEARLIGSKRELPARRKDGTLFPVELSVNMAEVGGRRLFIGVLNDITARKQAEVDLTRALEAAVSADAAMTSFLAHVSHELRTPLTAILGFAQMIEQEVMGRIGQPVYRAYAADIEHSAAKLLGHIDALLDMARLHRAEALDTAGSQLVTVADLLDAVIAEVDHRADRLGLHLSVEVVPPSLAVVSDAEVVRRILLALLDNALKYTEAGGAVAVRATLEEEPIGPHGRAATTLRLDICDTGCGIPAEHLSSVTRPMTPAAVWNADARRGIGVGLGMVQTLLALRGGRFELTSVEHQGTRATCWLPVPAG